jgi:hypothetical protein
MLCMVFPVLMAMILGEAEVAMASAFHHGLRAGEFQIRIEAGD